MKIKQLRFCTECGKQHDTGIENKLTESFERIDKCIDCLMGKCSFNFTDSQITVEDCENLLHNEMHKELGEILLRILKNNYETKISE